MAYSERFIEELIENMPACITTFFEKNQEILELTDYTFHEYVSETLELRYKNYNRRELLSPVAVKVMRARVDKMNSLLENYHKLLELKVTNPKSPLHYITLLPDSERNTLFNNMTYEDIISLKKEESIAWRESSSSYLTEFVGIPFLSKTLKINSLRVDIAVFFWRYIDEVYGGNLSTGFVKRILADYPIIAGNSFKEVLEQAEDGSDFFSLKSYNSEELSLTVPVKGMDDYFLKDLRALDPAAIMVLSVIINSIPDMERFSKTHTVRLPLGEIVKEAFDYRSAFLYEKVKYIIRYMHLVSYAYFDVNTMVEPYNIHIFNGISFPKVGETEWVEVVFDDKIVDDIVGNNVLSISKMQYKKLTDSNAKVICHVMKKEQITANREFVERTADYDYTFFIGKMRFPSANIKTIISILKAAFDDFINQGIIIESYKVIDNHFSITFLPYDEENGDDL